MHISIYGRRAEEALSVQVCIQHKCIHVPVLCMAGLVVMVWERLHVLTKFINLLGTTYREPTPQQVLKMQPCICKASKM
jgi:hypothetical protein